MSAHGDYASFDVKQLFRMVDAARRDLPRTRDQIQAWQRVGGMLRGHGDTLQGYRNDLAAQWPPEQNAASAAYLRHLDDLLSAVDQTADAAATNGALLAQVADEIERTHTTLKPLYDEYVSNEKKLADYQAQLAAAQAAGSTAGTVTGRVAGDVVAGPVGGDLASKVSGALGGLVAKTGMELFTSPPVPDGRQTQLNQQARDAMTSLGGVAQDTSSHLQAAPPYEPPRVNQRDTGTDLAGDTTGGAVRPPAIAPPAHARASSVSGSAGQAGPAPDGPGPATAGADPVLSGGAVGTHRADEFTAVAGSPASSPLGSLAAGMMLGLPPTVGAYRGRPGGTATTPSPPRATGEPGPGVERTGGPGTERATRALPPGGVIGGEPGIDGIDGRTAAGTRRVNPVGGVLGQGDTGIDGATGRDAARGGPEGRPGSGEPGRVGPGVLGGQRGGRDDEGEEYTWDPDNPWVVVGGVVPVIEPDQQPDSHEPGPGVIGIDR